MPDIAETLADTLAVLRFVGRTPYRVENFGADYDVADGVTRYIDFATPNAWSSASLLTRHIHLPVLDVDALGEGALPIICEVMGVDPKRVTLIPSTTEGHFHAYIDEPFTWDAYERHLRTLAERSVLEQGYVDAGVRRMATFVRMPGVLKEPSTPATGTPGLVLDSPLEDL